MKKFRREDLKIEAIQAHMEVLFAQLNEGEYREVRLIKWHEGKRYCGRLGYFQDYAPFEKEMWNEIKLRSPGGKDAPYIMGSVLDSNTYASAHAVSIKDYGYTSNKDVLRRLTLLIDIDPIREGTIPATVEELGYAEEKHMEIIKYLRMECELSSLAYVGLKTGNGTALQVFIDLPNDKDSELLTKRVLHQLTAKFSDDKVKVDTTVYDAARIMRVAGFPNLKNVESEGREFRIAELTHTPDFVETYDIAKIEANLSERSDSAAIIIDSKEKRGIPAQKIKSTPKKSPAKSKTAEKEDFPRVFQGRTIPDLSTGSRMNCSCPLCDGADGNNLCREGESDEGFNWYACYALKYFSGLGKEDEDYCLIPFAPGGGEVAFWWDDKSEHKESSSSRLPVYNKKERLLPRNVACNYVDLQLKKARLIALDKVLYQYDKGVFKKLDDQSLQMKLQQELKPQSTSRDIYNCLFAIKTAAYVSADVAESDGKVINLQNGLFDLESFELKEHTPDHISFVQIPINYEPEAGCPRWLKFLDETFAGLEDQKEIISYLQEWFGYCLQRELNLEKMLLLFGPGANGKSVTLEILERLVGKENASSLSLARFHDRFSLVEIQHKLVNICAEADIRYSVNEGVLKAVISGENVTADRKYLNALVYRPYAKLVMACNALPKINDKSQGAWRKISILPFFNTVDVEKRIPGLAKSIFIEEGSGIFNWAITGLKRLIQRKRFVESPSMLKQLETYRVDNNSVLLWFGECCERNPEGEAVTKYAYQEYRLWCGITGRKPMNSGNFGKEIAKLEVEKKRCSKPNKSGERPWIYQGFKIVESHETSYVK